MRLEILGGWELPHFDRASLRVEGYVLLGLYILVFLAIFYARRGDWRSLRGRRFALLLLLALLTVPLNNVLWLRFPTAHILPPPGVPTEPLPPSVPLLGSLSIFLAGALFGAGPATLIGLVAGLVRGGLESSRVFAPFELGFYGLVIGFLLQQAYYGREWRLFREPVAAGLVGAVCQWVLLGIGIYGATAGSTLSALDHTRSWLLAGTGAVALDGVISGLLVQGLYAVVPRLRYSPTDFLTPPHLRSMNRRLLTVLIPLTLLVILVMFVAVTGAAIKEATNEAVAGMTRDADNVAEMVPTLFEASQESLQSIAAEEQLRSSDPEARQNGLMTHPQFGFYGPIFSELILFDREGKLLNYYPDDGASPQLSPEEDSLLQRTLSFGSPERSHVFATGDAYLVSFFVPVEDDTAQRYGALVGRAPVDMNPALDNLFASLQGSGTGEPGFVVDERGLVVFHPDATFLLQPRSIDPSCSEISGISAQVKAQARGRACEELAENNTRRFVYYAPVEAMEEWFVVITYPYQRVLDRATRISRQLLLSPLAVTGLLAVAVVWVTSRLTRRLQLLATATRSITEGQLDQKLTLAGEDEVGQLGRAFEQMQSSLKDRLDELSLLLRVGQTVSGSLDMTHGIHTILDGALQATAARLARLIVLDERGDAQFTIPQGQRSDNVTAVDRAVTRLGQQGETVTIDDIAQSRGLIEPGLVGPDIQALIAVPVRSKDHDLGVMWLGYDKVHRFSSGEIDLLSTLASQAAVAVENARLFQAAEGGRRQLSAILESTSDAVIVTDHADRVLLLNPAAAELFGVNAKAAIGLAVARVVQDESVIRQLTTPMNNGGPLTGEVPLPDGRTFYASTSVIVSSTDETIGRVTVLRDITYLKELDSMKDAFVETVSHDLRTPLTYVRGYAAMVPMAGAVSPVQQKYLDKIVIGVEQMKELIEDLLDLGRIEAGVGLKIQPFQLDDIIVRGVESMRARATAKGLSLRLNRVEEETSVLGDATLLGRVISNLVDNAIKYTPEGGIVTVSWETRGERVLISVADTGFGIAKADQVSVFGKFSRIRRPETIEIKGSGLGLAIVKSIVGWHNGRVWVESELGKGSTFYVELPVGKADVVRVMNPSVSA